MNQSIQRIKPAHPRYIGGIIAALLAGVIMGLFLKIVENETDSGVYTLLLNIDFLTDAAPFNEWIEFSLHLVVSMVIGAVFAWLINFRQWYAIWGLVLGCAAIPLYIPLSYLSERTPTINDSEAWLWWIAGHILFGIILAVLGRILAKPKGRPSLYRF